MQPLFNPFRVRTCVDGIKVGCPNPACYAGLSYLTPSAWRIDESEEFLIRNSLGYIDYLHFE